MRVAILGATGEVGRTMLQVLEERLCLWDGAESALAFSSGMSAITTSLLTYLRPGDAIVHSEPVYGGTEYLLHNVLPQFGVRRIGFAAGSTTALELRCDLGWVPAEILKVRRRPVTRRASAGRPPDPVKPKRVPGLISMDRWASRQPA